MPAMIWIDDALAGFGVESVDLTQVSVIVFDKALLHDGGTIAVSYGTHDRKRSELPEKLKLSQTK